jgi:AraC-like DNA-binding protein
MPGHRPQVLSCGRSRGAPRGLTPPHRHPGVELLWLERGKAAVTAGGRSFQLTSGSILRLPAGCAHDQRDLRALRMCYVVIDPGGSDQPAEPESYQLAEDEPVGRWIADLVAMHLAPGGAVEAEAGLIAAILARLDHLAGRDAQQRRLPPALAALMRHCEADPLDDRDEAALARLAGVSASHLRTLCREHLGVPPGEFRRNLRLQLAQKLLRSSYLGIAAVAGACGWEDANYFARLFRSRTGMSPRAFRRRYRA